MSYKYLYKSVRLFNLRIDRGFSNYVCDKNDVCVPSIKLKCSSDLIKYHIRLMHTSFALLNKDVISSQSSINKGIAPEIIATTDIEKLKDSVKSSSNIKLSNGIPEKTPSALNLNKAATSKSQEVVPAVKLPLWKRIKNELVHYYHGFRLLFLEVKVTLGILNTLTKGQTLTRRERKQLVRTSADLARMVPFLIFIIVPFMEFLLPFYIKFFPFMMPSTFQENSKELEKTRQLLKGKLEIAKFLQDTLTESTGAKQEPLDGKVNLRTFSNFLKQVRDSGLTANTEDILRYSQLFEDEVTLESLEHSQLKALCKMLELNVMGPPTLLRFQLRMRVRHLKADDQLLSSEGIDKIPVWELQQLCRERGMRSIGVSEDRLRYQLSQWLSLHLENKVPITLLLLTRIIYLPETLTAEEKLKQAIRVLPESVSNEAKLKAVTTEERIDNKTKFEVIKEEQKVIKQERDEANKAAKESVAKEADVSVPQQETEDKAPVIATGQAPPDTAPKVQTPVGASESVILTPEIKTGEGAKDTAPQIKPEISIADLSQIESAIENLQKSKVAFAKEELDDLKESREVVSKILPEIITAEQPNPVKEKVAKRLSEKVDKMISEMDNMVVELHKDKVEESESIDQTDKSAKEEKTPKSIENERFISVTDLRATLSKIDKLPDDVKWKQILDVLDEDGDGMIEMDHIMKMIQLLGTDDVKLSNNEVTRLLDMLDKEAIIAESRRGGPHKEG